MDFSSSSSSHYMDLVIPAAHQHRRHPAEEEEAGGARFSSGLQLQQAHHQDHSTADFCQHRYHHHHQQQQQNYHHQMMDMSPDNEEAVTTTRSSSETDQAAGTTVGGGGGPGAAAAAGYVLEREHMFDKVVTPSDVGKLNRLVIPKQHAEKYFPLDSSTNVKGLLLSFEDRSGKAWRFRYSYWNSSQSYVMTKGWSRFVKEKKLDAGDIVSFQRGVGEHGGKDRFFIDWRRRQPEITPSQLLPPGYQRGGSGLGFFNFAAANYSSSSVVPDLYPHHYHHHEQQQLLQMRYPSSSSSSSSSTTHMMHPLSALRSPLPLQLVQLPPLLVGSHHDYQGRQYTNMISMIPHQQYPPSGHLPGQGMLSTTISTRTASSSSSGATYQYYHHPLGQGMLQHQNHVDRGNDDDDDDDDDDDQEEHCEAGLLHPVRKGASSPSNSSSVLCLMNRAAAGPQMQAKAQAAGGGGGGSDGGGCTRQPTLYESVVPVVQPRDASAYSTAAPKQQLRLFGVDMDCPAVSLAPHIDPHHQAACSTSTSSTQHHYAAAPSHQHQHHHHRLRRRTDHDQYYSPYNSFPLGSTSAAAAAAAATEIITRPAFQLRLCDDDPAADDQYCMSTDKGKCSSLSLDLDI